MNTLYRAFLPNHSKTRDKFVSVKLQAYGLTIQDNRTKIRLHSTSNGPRLLVDGSYCFIASSASSHGNAAVINFGNNGIYPVSIFCRIY